MNSNQLRAATRILLKASATVPPTALDYLTVGSDQWAELSRVLPAETTDLRECVRWSASANTLEDQGRIMEAKTDLEHALTYARKIAEANDVDYYYYECLVARVW